MTETNEGSGGRGASGRRPFLPPRWFIRTAWIVHRALYRVTGRRRGLRRPTDTQWGTMALHSIGRKTGQPREAILAYYEDDRDVFTLAMNGWGDAEPAWWLNLQANPNATIELPGERREVVARQATPEERPRLWARYGGGDPTGSTDGYAARRSRETAVVILSPRD